MKTKIERQWMAATALARDITKQSWIDAGYPADLIYEEFGASPGAGKREITAEDEARWRAADALARQIIRQSWIDAGNSAEEYDAAYGDAPRKRRKAPRPLLAPPVQKRPA